ncbi:MAG: hypothetical protein ACLTKG_06975 [Collinsella intestinalis]
MDWAQCCSPGMLLTFLSVTMMQGNASPAAALAPVAGASCSCSLK